MIVEGPVGPVRGVVADRVGALPVHLGNHGLLFFLWQTDGEHAIAISVTNVSNPVTSRHGKKHRWAEYGMPVVF